VAGTYTAPVNDVIGDNGNYSPSYLQSAYNIPALTAAYGGGSGTIVALLEAGPDPNMANDLAYYRAEFGLAPCPAGTVSTSNPGCVFETVNSSGQTSPIDNSVTDWDGETALDIDMVSAICPACQILVVIIGSTGQGNQMVVNGTNSAILLGASVVDIQIAFEDLSYSASYDNALSHPGIPVIAPAGDGGYSALTWPASSPTVIAVGATVLTQLTDTGTRNGVETAANFSASGCDPYAPKPSWQTDTGCTNRMVADVSAVGQQVWSYDSTPQSGIPLGWTGTAGTSVSAPVVAGIYALAGNVAGNTTNPASWLYASANTLYQVTGGITGTCNIGYYCDASQNQNGYSGPAGLGTPGGCDSIAAFRPPNTTVAPAGCAVG
jgi:subtilase family serine protease